MDQAVMLSEYHQRHCEHVAQRFGQDAVCAEENEAAAHAGAVRKTGQQRQIGSGCMGSGEQ
jgi:hypothetical protein